MSDERPETRGNVRGRPCGSELNKTDNRYLNAKSNRNDPRKEEVFASLVAPSFTMFEQVHKDYIKNFTKLQSIFDSEEWLTRDTVLWLREVSVEHVSDRDRLKEFHKNHDNLSNYFRRSGWLDGDKQLIEDAFSEYANSIAKYFDSGDKWNNHVSWYTEFLQFLEIRVYAFEDRYQYLKDNRLIPEGMERDALIKALKIGTFSDRRVQSWFDEKLIFDLDMRRLGIRMDSQVFKRTVIYLREQFTETTHKYERLSSLCSYQ